MLKTTFIFTSLLLIQGCIKPTLEPSYYSCLSNIHWSVSKQGIYHEEYNETSFKDVTKVGGDCEDFAYTMYLKASSCPDVSNIRIVKFLLQTEEVHAILLVDTPNGTFALDFLQDMIYKGNETSRLRGQADRGIGVSINIEIPAHKL